MTNVENIYRKGLQILEDEHKELEATKKGILRAGNTALAEVVDGVVKEVAGKCMRQSYLRYKGISIPESEDDTKGEISLMFQGGIASEDSWYSVLSRGHDGVIKREEEIPISWTLENGVTVSGRPDMILCDAEGTPIHGLELKNVSSVWTCRDIMRGEPKLQHLSQAAHYAWQLGDLEFTLFYSSRVNWTIPSWAVKHFPKPGDLGSEHIEYSPLKPGNEFPDIKKILPFRQGYRLRFNKQGTLEFNLLTQQGKLTGWRQSIVTKKRIEDYFRAISKMDETNQLGPRPKNLRASGEPESWKACSYCPLSDVCDKYEKEGLKVWLKEVEKKL